MAAKTTSEQNDLNVLKHFRESGWADRRAIARVIDMVRSGREITVREAIAEIECAIVDINTSFND